MSLKKSKKIHNQRKSHYGKQLQIYLGYHDWGALQKIKKLLPQTCGLHRRCRPKYVSEIHMALAHPIWQSLNTCPITKG